MKHKKHNLIFLNMSSVLKKLVNKYMGGILRVLADDEVISISRENAQLFLFITFAQRLTLFFKAWGLLDTPYEDEKIIYTSNILSWFTMATLLSILNGDIFNMIAMYSLYTYHITSFILQLVLVFLQKYFAKSIIQTLSKLLYVYFSVFYYITLFPSILYASRQIICERQTFIVQDTVSCGQPAQVANGILIFTLLFYQCITYSYLYRNITLPINNYLKKRYCKMFNLSIAPLTILILIMDFPCLVLQQYITETYYIAASFCKLFMALLYFYDTWYYRPLQSRINVSLMLCFSTILVFDAILFLIYGFYRISEDALVYLTMVMCPLFMHSVIILFDKRTLSQREEDILYWIDELHVFEAEMKKKDASYSIRWIDTILRHSQTCTNTSCTSHTKVDLTDMAQVKTHTNGVVICLISLAIAREEDKPMKERRSMENLYLNYITYLSFECFSPLKGYIQLKQYEIKSNNSSLFFKLICQDLSTKLEFKTKQLQNLKYQHLVRDNYLEKLDIKELRRSEDLNAAMIPLIIKVVEEKVNLWSRLLIGYPRIEDFLEQATIVSKRIWDVKNMIFSNLKIDPLHISKSLSNLNGLELKTLSIIYSVVLNDYYGTMDIEHKLEEIFQFERNLQQEIILNTGLLYEDVVVIVASVLKNRGKILNKDRNLLARFFHFDGERDFARVSLVEQLMPDFVSKKHNGMIENYIQLGHSRLFSAQLQVFYNDSFGFTYSCNLRLANLFDNTDDYMITASILKTKVNMNFLLFDIYGRILGISQELFTYFTQETQITVQTMMQKGFVFFWIHQICDALQSDVTELLPENNHTSTLKTMVVHLQKNTQQTIKEFDLFRQTLKQDYFGRLEQQRTKNTTSRADTRQMRNIQTSNQENQQSSLSIEDDEQTTNNILGIQVPLISRQLKNQLDTFYNEYQGKMLNAIQHSIMTMKYVCQFKTIADGNSTLGYFVLHISELRLRDMQDTSNRVTQQPQTNDSFATPDVSKINLQSEFDEYGQINSEEINVWLNEPVINKHRESNEADPIKEQEPIMLRPSFDENEQEAPVVDPMASQIASPRGQTQRVNLLQQEEIEEIEEDNLHKESSNKDQRKRDLLQIIRQNKVENHLQAEDGAHRSQSSGTSDKTQNSIFNLLKLLQYREAMPKGLIYIYLINTFACICLLSFVIIKIILIRDNLSTLQEQLVLIESPNQFNQFYCTFSVYIQMNYLYMFDNGYNLNDYAFARLQEGSRNNLAKLTPLAGMSKNQFAPFQESGELEPVKVYRIQGSKIVEENLTFFQFLFYFNQDSYQQDILIQREANITKRLLASSYTMKLNILSEMKLAKNLLDAVYNSFFSTLDANAGLYTILLCLEIMMFALIIPMQLPFWKSHYLYQQRILLLISRAQLKDAEQAILKFKYIKDFLSDSQSKWKRTNFLLLMFINNHKQTDQLAKVGEKDNRSTLTSRIQEPRFTHRVLYMLLLVFTLLLQAFLIAMYIYSKALSDATRPQLELSMSFIQLKQNYDSMNMLAFMIKSEPLVAPFTLETFHDVAGLKELMGTMEVDQIKMFVSLNSNLYASFETIYDQIVNSNKISSGNRDRLLALYQSDLCTILYETLPFCDFTGKKFTLFPKYPLPYPRDNYRKSIRYGMTGLLEAFRATISSAYIVELNEFKYDLDIERTLNYAYSQEFTTLIMSYYLDLYQPFALFQSTISKAAVDMLKADFDNNSLMHSILCGLQIVIIQYILIWQIQKGVKRIRAIRQALVNLPFSMLLDPQTVSQLKRLDQD